MYKKYNRLRHGDIRIDKTHKQCWIGLNNFVDYDKAVDYLEKEYLIEEITYLSDFLNKFKFATQEQINTYLKIGEFSTYGIDMDALVDYGILNKFVIGENTCDVKRGEEIYSIGANMVLFRKKRLGTEDVRLFIKDISLGAQQIVKKLDIVDFYLSYIKKYGKDIFEKVTVEPLLRVMGDCIRVDAEFVIREGNKLKQILAVVITKSNVNTTMPKTMLKLEKLHKSHKVDDYLFDSGESTEIMLLCENKEVLEYASMKLLMSPLAKESKTNLISMKDLLSMRLLEPEIYTFGSEGSIKIKEIYYEGGR